MDRETLLKQTFEAIETGDYQGYMDSLIALCENIDSTPEDTLDYWYDEYSLWDLIDASYFHFCEYHEGQYSRSYEALSALSKVYKPSPLGQYEESNGLKESIDFLV
jgi:hypothetical protein